MVGLEFGEKVLFKLQAGAKIQKINPRWEYGIFVGLRRRSNEILVARPEGITAVRSVRRIPFEKRRGVDCLNWVQWAPWNKHKGDVEEDGEIPEGVPADEAVETGGEQKIFIETRERAPRDFYLTKKEAEKHGYTRGCGGCNSWFRGLGRAPHTPACRERFRTLLREDAKVKSAEARKKEFEEREGDRKRRK
ncbi:MAG: hypothetical protein VXZ35_09485, partial [Pseudomonadota bacterium]|nr:hypothetical protein [Pseudomonadota bacterium]